MKMRFLWAVAVVNALGLGTATSFANDEESASQVRSHVQDHTVHVSEFDLPLSGFLSAETRATLKRQTKEVEKTLQLCPFDIAHASEKDIVAVRQCADKYYYPGVIAKYRARYKVNVQAQSIAGVPTEIISPVDGVTVANKGRVLINLHGGGFIWGARWGGQIESIPIATVGKIKVVSVDYRMAPEYRFPAATEDVAAVYTALLKDYQPKNIGIYGCSAGGVLTAESVSWFEKHGLPAPGAIGMFGAGAFLSNDNDSTHFADAIAGSHWTVPEKLSYFRGVDPRNPLAYPGVAPEVMARFPDSLLITSTRDTQMSPVVVTHTRLVSLGVKADLHVWEGLGHCFFFEPDFPESREVYEVVARFFDKQLSGD
jgi:acetyl esterase/lipase